MRKKIFLVILLSLSVFILFAQSSSRKLIDCQNIAINGGESPKWVSLLFDENKKNEKKARKLLSIAQNELIFYQKEEGQSLDIIKLLAKQKIYQRASGFSAENNEVQSTILNALHKAAEFWILEEESGTKEQLYTYYTVYSMVSKADK